MDFAGLILFLMLYYVRPQEWLSVIKPFQPVTLIMIFVIIATFMRKGGVSRKSIFKTPHDWLILGLMLWIHITSADPITQFTRFYPLYLSYVVAVQILDSMERIRRFLLWWAIMIFALSALAVASEYGFDPTNAQHITQGIMRGRLSMGTSIFNNPNALGHSVVPVVLMLYFLLVWKRPIFVRIGSIPLFAVPLYCIYLTVSKGSYISGFASLVGALTFGRPKAVQLLIVFSAITIGWAGIKMLPRMQEIEDTKEDEAVQGRVLSFKFGLRKLETTLVGVGVGNFVIVKGQETGVPKASHSTYVQIGGELGRPGLFIFLAIIYCCLRTLVQAQTRDEAEERVRRILFSMIIAYLVSSWMVDFAFRTAFFLFVGAIAAYHRLLLKKQNEPLADDQTVSDALNAMPAMPWRGLGQRPAMAGPIPINQTTIGQSTLTIPPASAALPDAQTVAPTDVAGLAWNRFGWREAFHTVLLMCAVLWFWRYAIDHF